MDGLIEMPGPLQEGEQILSVPEGQDIEGGNTLPGGLAPPPYEQQ